MNIAISGLNSSDNPAPGVGVAKSLKEHNLIGLSYNPNEPGIYQGIFNKIYLMPYPTLGFKEFKKRVMEIKRDSDIDIIIPNLDAELPLYIKYQEEIKSLGIKSYLPTLASFEARDKSNLAELSKELGAKYPLTMEICSLEELIEVIQRLNFPLIIKGNYYRAYLVRSLEEAIEHYYNILNEWGLPILVQKVVRGSEINYMGVGDGEELVGGVGMKKLTTTALGKVWSGVSIKNSRLLGIAKEFVKRLKWRGAFEIEAISDGKDIYLIEINPRFPAWIYFGTMLNINLPKMMIDLIEGKEVKKQFEYETQKLYIRFVDETLSEFEKFKKLLRTKQL